MTNYFFTDAQGNKCGPLTVEQLQTLAYQGVVTPTTPLETDGGHRGLAGKVSGLKFPVAAPPPSTQTPDGTHSNTDGTGKDADC